MLNDKELEALLELIKTISMRPVMFVGAPYNFSAVASFIDGFMYAREGPYDPRKTTTLWGFSFWLSEKLDRPKNWAWSTVLIDFYKEDDKALEMLPIHFEEFLKAK